MQLTKQLIFVMVVILYTQVEQHLHNIHEV